MSVNTVNVNDTVNVMIQWMSVNTVNVNNTVRCKDKLINYFQLQCKNHWSLVEWICLVFFTSMTQCSKLSKDESAIETMEDKNKNIATLIKQHRHNAHLGINPLSMTLNWVVDTAVQRGHCHVQNEQKMLSYRNLNKCKHRQTPI